MSILLYLDVGQCRRVGWELLAEERGWINFIGVGQL